MLRRVLDRIGTTDPVNLSVLRIVVFTLLASWAPFFLWFNTVPRVFMKPPFAWGVAVKEYVHTGLISGTVIAILFQIACVCAALGLATRVSTTSATVLGFWVLGVPQFFEKIDHYHHLIWFGAILAASPSGEVLSLDSYIRRRRGGRPPLRAVSALPLLTVWFLLGLIYFFPGYWKLSLFEEWVFGDYLRLHLWDKWAELGPSFQPLARIDQYPAVYRTLGLLTITFELSFIFFLLNRRTRLPAAAVAIAFHLSTKFFMGIDFTQLIAMYVSVIDWAPLVRRLWSRPLTGPVQGRPSKPAVLTCATLLIANLFCGFAGIDSWPFSIYPTFAYRPSPIRTTLHLAFFDSAGRRLPVDTQPVEDGFGGARWTRVMRRILQAPPDRQRLLTRELIQLLGENGVELDRVAIMRFYVQQRRLTANRERDPVRRKLILELRMERQSRPAAASPSRTRAPRRPDLQSPGRAT